MSGRYDMDRGLRPEGCTCIMHRGPRNIGNPNHYPEPAEWEQADDCPVHPLDARPVAVDW